MTRHPFEPALLTGLSLLVCIACGSSDNGADDSGDRGGATSAGSGGSPAGVAGNAGLGGMSGTAGSSGGGSGGGNNSTPPGDYAMASTQVGSCALDAAGAIHCWGNQLGTWVVPSGAFAELHASNDAVCAIRADHSVTCFDPPAAVSGVADMVPSKKVTALGLQRSTLCAIGEDGATFCNSDDDNMTPPAGEQFANLSVGVHFACGIRTSDGSILCWGGAGNAGCISNEPAAGQLMAPAGAFVSVSSGFFSSCAIDRSGNIACWGAGEASDDPKASCMGSNYNLGQATPPSGTFRSVSVGANHACAVKTDGTVACWGAGTQDSDCTALEDPNCRQSRPPAGTFAQVSVGSLHSCAMTADRKVKCWGYPGSGMGDGRLTPPAEFQ